jgi:hypothetical protein
LPGQPGDQVRRNLRRVGERLAINAGQLGNQLEGILLGDHELRVIGAKVLCNRPCMLGFVSFGVAEANGECFYKLASLTLHVGDHEG